MSNTLSGMWIALLVLATLAFAGLTAAPADATQGRRTGAITGTVTDVHGQPVHDALVTLEDLHHHVVGTTSSDNHGEFDFPHVHPGHHTVNASKRHVGHGSAGVLVQAGHTATVHIVLQ